jgi:hypothetical protein
MGFRRRGRSAIAVVEDAAEPPSAATGVARREPSPLHDPDSQRWLTRLRGGGAERDRAVEELHALLLRDRPLCP